MRLISTINNGTILPSSRRRKKTILTRQPVRDFLSGSNNLFRIIYWWCARNHFIPFNTDLPNRYRTKWVYITNHLLFFLFLFCQRLHTYTTWHCFVRQLNRNCLLGRGKLVHQFSIQSNWNCAERAISCVHIKCNNNACISQCLEPLCVIQLANGNWTARIKRISCLYTWWSNSYTTIIKHKYKRMPSSYPKKNKQFTNRTWDPNRAFWLAIFVLIHFVWGPIAYKFISRIQPGQMRE